MSELDANTQIIPEEWLAVPEIQKAVSLAEEAAYTPAELASYEKYWDAVSTEKTLISGFYKKGLEQGREEEKRTIAQALLAKGLSLEEIAFLTGLSVKQVTALQRIEK